MDNIDIRPACPDDCALILNWRNDPESQKQSYNSSAIDPETHRAWFERKIQDPACLFYVLTFNGIPAGQFRIDIQNGIGEISYTVAPSYRGMGLGTALLLSAFRTGEGKADALIGFVRSGNPASKRCFEKAGFTEFKAGDDSCFILLFR